MWQSRVTWEGQAKEKGQVKRTGGDDSGLMSNGKAPKSMKGRGMKGEQAQRVQPS